METNNTDNSDTTIAQEPALLNTDLAHPTEGQVTNITPNNIHFQESVTTTDDVNSNTVKRSEIEVNQTVILSSPISSLSLHLSNNSRTSLDQTTTNLYASQPLPSTSCNIKSPFFLNLPPASIEIPTLFQICVSQLNKSSISLSTFKNISRATPALQLSTNHLTCKLNNVEVKSAGLTTPNSLTSAPPSYSFVLRQMDIRRRPRLVGTFIPSPSFIAKPPPPTYATAFDIFVDNALAPPPRMYNYGFTSMPIVCPECGYAGMSVIRTRVTICTHLCALALCIFCCWFCVPLPYVLRSCKNVYHYCRNCRTLLGMYCPTNPENVY